MGSFMQQNSTIYDLLQEIYNCKHTRFLLRTYGFLACMSLTDTGFWGQMSTLVLESKKNLIDTLTGILIFLHNAVCKAVEGLQGIKILCHHRDYR